MQNIEINTINLKGCQAQWPQSLPPKSSTLTRDVRNLSDVAAAMVSHSLSRVAALRQLSIAKFIVRDGWVT